MSPTTQDFIRWRKRRYWLYPDCYTNSSDQWPDMNRSDWIEFLKKEEDISNEQIKCEMDWDELIQILINKGWIEKEKMFFESPYNGKQYEVRTALILEQEKTYPWAI